MKLSVVMMVKNEERYLDDCLSSLKPVIDKIKTELIIIDTGSQDRTVEIAKKHTDKVYFHKWNSDFASMRNKTISYARGEWILVLDGDEILKGGDSLVEFLESPKSKQYNTGRLTIRNITSGKKQGDVYFGLLRLFKNTKEFCYKGAIHEQPQYQEPICDINVMLDHYGYLSTDKELMELKYTRNVEILKDELKKDPKNIYYWYQLSSSYGMYKDYKKALEANLKAYTIAKENNIALGNHMYVYTHLALTYFWNEKYKELEKICLEALGEGKKYIDLYFFLGRAQKELGRHKKAIESYKKYLKGLKKHKELQIMNDVSVPTLTLGIYEEAYLDLCILYEEVGNKEEALKYAKKIKSQEVLKKALPSIIKLYIDLNKDEELKKEYKKILITNEDMSENFWIYVETAMLALDDDKKDRLIELFSKGDCKYTLLNKVRLSLKNNHQTLSKEFINEIKEIDISNLPLFFADIIYLFLKNKYDLESILQKSRENVIESHIGYLSQKYSDLDKTIFMYLINKKERVSLTDYRVEKVLEKNYLLMSKLVDEDYKNILDQYILDGISYITKVYNKDILDNELIYDVKNTEDAFLVYMYLANKYEESNVDQYVRYLRKALRTYPEMNKVIEVLLERIKEKQKYNETKLLRNNNQELQIYQKQIKDQIRTLIENGKIDLADDLIDEYESVIKEDIEIYSMKSVILMMEGNMEEARQILLDGLRIEPEHLDLLYNLDYIDENFGEDRIEESKNISKKAKEELGLKKSPAVSIVTWAYNAEAYIKECAESVLNQTFENFEWIILDNGSTDKTGEILKEYSCADSRIKLFKNKKNSMIHKVGLDEAYMNYVDTLESEYVCTLDSDDYLHLEYLKELYTVAKQHGADIVVCGTEMFNDKNRQSNAKRVPPNFYTKDVTKLGDIFPNVYGSFRPLWGKLVKVPISYKSRKTFVNNGIKMVNGADTMLNLYYLKFANSIVLIDKVLHYYRIRESSLYHASVDKTRYLDYKMIYNETKQLLESWDKLTEINLHFIGHVLYYSIIDCVNIAAIATDVNLKDKLKIIESILSDELINDVINNAGLLPSFIKEIQKNLKILVEE